MTIDFITIDLAKPVRRAWCAAAVMLCAAIVVSPLPAAADPAAGENAVKAAYLFKLRNYVEWPGKQAAGGAPLAVIGVVGADEIAENLVQIPGAGEGPDSKVQVRRLRSGDSIDGINIVFVGAPYWTRAQAMVRQAGRQGVLVVSDTPGALEDGSMVNFRTLDERLRFEIALDTAERAGLKLSSQLLALALSVAREKRK